jgi:hypothetical protein
MVAGVGHRRKKKSFTEEREKERHSQWLFQTWAWLTGGHASDTWWS